MTDSSLWFPGANLSHKATVDGGSILGGRPKCLWHDTETTGLPSYSTGYFPNLTICGSTPYQHIPANRAARALRNPAGGVQTNRWNVFQIEVCGYANRVQYAPVMRDVAQWLKEARGCPLTCTVNTLPYPQSYGSTNVRLSGSAWNNYAGHLFHMSAPENDHGDPGSPFPIREILATTTPVEEDEMSAADVQAINSRIDKLEATMKKLLGAVPATGVQGSLSTLAHGDPGPDDERNSLDSLTEQLDRIETLLKPPA